MNKNKQPTTTTSKLQSQYFYTILKYSLIILALGPREMVLHSDADFSRPASMLAYIAS
jgi:hypothetical protein